MILIIIAIIVVHSEELLEPGMPLALLSIDSGLCLVCQSPLHEVPGVAADAVPARGGEVVQRLLVVLHQHGGVVVVERLVPAKQ